jgi:DNA-binding NarL/FixJ family response regulator
MAGTVLVVEDEPDARESLLRGLRRAGWTATGAANGQLALPLLADGRWTAVVTDLHMPLVDGFAVLAASRRHDPRTLRVAVTAFGDKPRILAALNSGADYLLEKPFSVAELDTVLTGLGAARPGPADLDSIYQQRLRALDLTEREQELVTLVLKGLPNRDIGSVLGIGEQTVKNSLQALYGRLGIGSRSELCHVIFPI